MVGIEFFCEFLAEEKNVASERWTVIVLAIEKWIGTGRVVEYRCVQCL